MAFRIEEIGRDGLVESIKTALDGYFMVRHHETTIGLYDLKQRLFARGIFTDEEEIIGALGFTAGQEIRINQFTLPVCGSDLVEQFEIVLTDTAAKITPFFIRLQVAEDKS